jgi:hypothetical protein
MAGTYQPYTGPMGQNSGFSSVVYACTSNHKCLIRLCFPDAMAIIVDLCRNVFPLSLFVAGIPCPRDTFSAAGSAACTPCAAGQFSDVGAAACGLPCPTTGSGQYLNSNGYGTPCCSHSLCCGGGGSLALSLFRGQLHEQR